MTNHLALIWLSAVIVVFVGVTSGQITTTTSTNASVALSSQDVVNAVLTANDKDKAESTAKFNAVLAVLNTIQTLIRDTGYYAGTKLTNEYFFEGVLAIQGTADFIRARDFFIAFTNDETIRKMPDQANIYYTTCITQNADANGLAKLITDVTQESYKIGIADVNFKVAVARCTLVNTVQAPGCADSARKANPLPQVNTSIINGLSLAKTHVKCLEEAISKTRAVGELAISSIRKVYPEDSKFMVPEKFDPMASRVLGQASSITIPTDKLNLAKTTLQQARNILSEAWTAKGTTLVSARSNLDGLFNNFNDLLGNVSVSSEAAFCMNTAKVNTVVNINIQSSALFTCILNIQAATTPQALLALEASLVERETKENISSSIIQCYKNINNALYPSELQCCLAQALDEYKVFLDDVTNNAQAIYKKASEIIDQYKQCNLTSVQAAQKKFDDDLGTLDKCLKKNTKTIITVPVINTLININANTVI